MLGQLHCFRAPSLHLAIPSLPALGRYSLTLSELTAPESNSLPLLEDEQPHRKCRLRVTFPRTQFLCVCLPVFGLCNCVTTAQACSQTTKRVKPSQAQLELGGERGISLKLFTF